MRAFYYLSQFHWLPRDHRTSPKNTGQKKPAKSPSSFSAVLHHNSPWAWGRAPSPAPRAYRLLENQPGGLQGLGGAQSSSEKAKSSTTSSSPWASCSRSERDSTWELLLCARCEPRGAALPSSGGGRRERCKSCCSEAGGGSSSLINPRHSLIYQCCCSSQIAVGECCRVMYSAGSEYWGRQESKVTAVPVPTSGLRL